MAVEIERKFLVKGEEWRSLTQGVAYRQGYISTQTNTTVRVRVVGEQGYLTIKGPTKGASRAEFEYAIPGEDAQEMLETLCDRPVIEKLRFKLEQDGLVWEIDEFLGENQGLILAEVELRDENQTIDLPDWIDTEVSDDPRYFNASLVKHPYTQWQEADR